jgi:hypothetical protein
MLEDTFQVWRLTTLILLCDSSTRVQCGRSLDNYLCSPQFLVVNRYNNACFVGDRSESVFSTVSPLAIYISDNYIFVTNMYITCKSVYIYY